MLPCPEGFFCPTGTFEPFECSALSSCPEGSVSQLYYGPLIACLIIDLVLAAILYAKIRMENKLKLKTIIQPVTNKVDTEEETTVEIPKGDDLLIEAFDKGLDHQKLFMRYDFENLGFKVKDTTVLQGVTGQIRPGKLTAIMGPSGAGKTTFLNVLMGKVKRTSGSLSLNGSEVSEISDYKKVIGFVVCSLIRL
jgi:ABC-type transport system involved in cytochrome bd biosynthesis fused ATPase/permease subunit